MNLSDQRVMVTGGAGYIGSHVAWALKPTGAAVTVVDRLSTGYKANVHYGDLVILDIEHTHELDGLMAHIRPTAIIHLASSVVAPESRANPVQYYNNNTTNTLSLIDLAVRHHVPHFILSSTAAVYGTTESGVCTESTPCRPITPYGRSKWMSEMMLRDISMATDLRYIALRYFNVAGAHPSLTMGQRMPDATHLINVLAKVVLKKRDRLPIFGTDYPTPDGTCIRDYIHVCDLANAHVLALNYLVQGGESDVLNCGESRGVSVQDVITAATKRFGPIPVDHATRRMGDPATLIADATRIQTVLNFCPQFNDIDDIIASAVAFEGTL